MRTIEEYDNAQKLKELVKAFWTEAWRKCLFQELHKKNENLEGKKKRTHFLFSHEKLS